MTFSIVSPVIVENLLAEVQTSDSNNSSSELDDFKKNTTNSTLEIE